MTEFSERFIARTPARIEVLQSALVGVEHATDDSVVLNQFHSGMQVLLTERDAPYTDVSMLARVPEFGLTDEQLRFNKARAAICLFEQALFSGVVGVDMRGVSTVEQYHDMQASLGQVPKQRHMGLWYDHYRHSLSELYDHTDQERAEVAFQRGRRAVDMAARFGFPRHRVAAARFMLSTHR